MQAYQEVFARVYDRLWGAFADSVGPIILDYYENNAPTPVSRTLLDLGCGTGRVATLALRRNYQVTGIDLSDAMLCRAREANSADVESGRVRFLQEDAANFRLDAPVSLAISTFNAMNHLEDFAALEACLRCVYAALVPGGLFVFDLNTRRSLKRWHGIINIQDNDDLMVLDRGLYDEAGGKAYTAISGFVRAENGLYERFDETISNTLFDLQQVSHTLLEVGWRQVRLTSLADLSTELEDPERETQVVFVAWK